MVKEGVARVLTHYDLGEFRSCRRIEHGHVNKNWLVETTTGRYFLKRRRADLDDAHLIAAQHALIQHLRRAEFPAPTLVLTRHGTTFVELKGEICEIHEYIPGVLCDRARHAHFAAAAGALGRYHETVSGFNHPILHRRRQRYDPTALSRIIHGLVTDWRGQTTSEVDRLINELDKHAEDLVARFAGFGEVPQLVIHGDYYAGNLIFQGDTLAGVIDFDLAHWTWRAMELAEAFIYFTAERSGELQHIVYPGALELDRVYQFLAAYCETARLSEAEIRALPHMMRTIWLCASLAPPLEPPMSVEAAPQALPEVLALASWGEAHAPDIVEIGLAASGNKRFK
ncbi:MAG: Homoserine kinase [Anaerolineales bacterium]|nr:Homoserine kinase [Anaerolineales bacterium]